MFRYGYAFVGEAADEAVGGGPVPFVAAGAACRVGPPSPAPRRGANVLGRDEDANLRIDAPGISRRHALIRVRGGETTLEDLDSKNGTFLRGSRLEGPVALRDGEVFVLGEVALVFRTGPLGGTTATAPTAGG